MLLQGLILMVVGVFIVSGFLGLLVVILTLSSKIIPRFNHILPDEQPKLRVQKAALYIHSKSNCKNTCCIKRKTSSFQQNPSNDHNH